MQQAGEGWRVKVMIEPGGSTAHITSSIEPLARPVEEPGERGTELTDLPDHYPKPPIPSAAVYNILALDRSNRSQSHGHGSATANSRFNI